jgi:hypothetical protein
MKFVLATIGLIFMAFILYTFIVGYIDCNDIGGTFVRTHFSFTCITK